MQFQVPQFIETEDKLVGPLTLRQFMYVGAAAGLSFLLFFTMPTWLWFILTVFLAGFAFALAFVKINGQSLVRVIFAAFRFFWQPQTYVWQPEHPGFRKDKAAMSEFTRPGFSLENIMAGLALKNTWGRLQTGTRKTTEGQGREVAKKIAERYQIFERISGERRAARRIDYR